MGTNFCFVLIHWNNFYSSLGAIQALPTPVPPLAVSVVWGNAASILACVQVWSNFSYSQCTYQYYCCLPIAASLWSKCYGKGYVFMSQIFFYYSLCKVKVGIHFCKTVTKLLLDCFAESFSFTSDIFERWLKSIQHDIAKHEGWCKCEIVHLMCAWWLANIYL